MATIGWSGTLAAGMTSLVVSEWAVSSLGNRATSATMREAIVLRGDDEVSCARGDSRDRPLVIVRMRLILEK